MPVRRWDTSLLLSQCIAFFFQRLVGAAVYMTTLLDIRIGILPKPYSSRPARKLTIRSSKDSARLISIHVYEPPPTRSERAESPLPVYISWHGSGFVLPCHTADHEICAYLALTLNCIVVDADYAHAPAYPHPAAIEDALDVIAYIASNPALYDLSRVALGGFSAGANIALLASLSTPKDLFNIKCVIAWYPCTNLAREGEPEKQASSVRRRIHKAFRQSYLPPGIDRADPKVSPLFAPSSLFPPTTLIVGEEDKLLVDSVDLAKKLKTDGRDCTLFTIPGAGHAWERFVKEGTPQWGYREQAFALVEQQLREAFGRELLFN